MMDLNMPFQHFVHCAGLAIAVLFVGLIVLCVISLLFSLCFTVTRQAELVNKLKRLEGVEDYDCVAEYLHITRSF